MELTLIRRYRGSEYTIGDLYINGEKLCNTLEDTDRGLTQTTPLSEIKEKKIPRETAIPTGTYKITLEVTSPKFNKYSFYKEVCDGKLPRLLEVPGFDGILIHVGEGPNGKNLTEGCILVGDNTIVGGLTNSKQRFKELYSKLLEDKDNITITIK